MEILPNEIKNIIYNYKDIFENVIIKKKLINEIKKKVSYYIYKNEHENNTLYSILTIDIKENYKNNNDYKMTKDTLYYRYKNYMNIQTNKTWFIYQHYEYNYENDNEEKYIDEGTFFSNEIEINNNVYLKIYEKKCKCSNKDAWYQTI
jgi:hypothetical protein